MGEDSVRKVPVDPWPDVDSRYKIRFWVEGKGGAIALLPETFSENVSSQWTAPWAAIPFLEQLSIYLQTIQQAVRRVSGALGPTAANIINSILGDRDITGKSALLTTHLWSSSSPLSLPDIRAVFVARSDAYEEVVKPARVLQSLVLPRGRVGKGATLGTLSAPYRVSVEVGHMLYLKRALVTACNITWSTVLDSDGYPQHAMVSLGIQTDQIYTIEEEKEEELAFKKPPGAWREVS